MDGTVQPARIIDYPDMKWRGTVLELRNMPCPGGKTVSWCLDRQATDCIKARVDRYSAMKLNVIIFHRHLLHTLETGNAKYLREIFQYCRERFIIPIPSLHSRVGFMKLKAVHCPPTPIPPQAREGYRVRDEVFTFDASGLARPARPAKNILKNGGFEESAAGTNNTPAFWDLQSVLSNGWSWVGQKAGTKAEGRRAHSGRRAVRLTVKQALVAHSTKMQPQSNPGVEYVTAHPDSYYELAFWARQATKSSMVIATRAQQFDSRGKPIAKGSFFSKKHTLTQKWKHYRMAIFTHSECADLKLVFTTRKVSKTGEAYLDDVTLARMNGALINVLPESESDLVISSEDGNRTYKPGVDYIRLDAPVHMDTNYELTDIPKTRIKRQAGSSIKMGQPVRISYDCLLLQPFDDDSRYCPMSAETYRTYRRLFRNLMPLSPHYILVDLDEYRGGYNRDSRCLDSKKTNAELFVHLVTTLNRLLHDQGDVEVVPGVKLEGLGRPHIRLLMWDDMVNYWHNGGREYGEYYQVGYGGIPGSGYLAFPQTPIAQDGISSSSMTDGPRLPRDVILLSWHYHPDDRHQIIKNSPGFYEARGYDYAGCPWDNPSNIKQWARQLCGRNSLGLIDTVWGRREKGIPITAAYAWNCHAGGKR